MKSSKNKGSLYLIPSLLSTQIDSIPPSVTESIQRLHHFFVENERSARRFFKAIDKNISIDDRKFSVINNHQEADLSLLKKWLFKGEDVGMVSEAGYPCIADPGNSLVAAVHQWQVRVIPLSGPNAMLMALSASGFNGQNFRFSGYLPRKSPQRIKALQALEQKVQRDGETQIFMEAPYRNEKMMDDILNHLHSRTQLCIAADLTAPAEFIQTRSVADWEKDRPNLHKRPVVFVLGK